MIQTFQDVLELRKRAKDQAMVIKHFGATGKMNI